MLFFYYSYMRNMIWLEIERKDTAVEPHCARGTC